MFIPRMWSDEVERIGKQRCTPLGYTLQGIGDLVGFVGLLLLLAVLAYLAYRGIAGTFHPLLLCLLFVPFGLGFLGSVIVSYSWSLAATKKFHYDYALRVSKWIDGKEEKSYTFADWEAGKRAG
jgi:hypothetical protein